MTIGDLLQMEAFISLDELSKLPSNATVSDILGMVGGETYISSTAIKRAVSEIAEQSPAFPHSVYVEIMRRIENIPKADVAPVVRGKWLKGDDDRFKCSACGSPSHFHHVSIAFDNVWFYYKSDVRHGNYCPKCGAKMEPCD